MTEEKKNPPVQEFKAGGIRAKIWKNPGKEGSYYTVSLERSYKDKEGNWQTTQSLRVNDLPKAGVVIGKAYEKVLELQYADRLPKG